MLDIKGTWKRKGRRTFSHGRVDNGPYNRSSDLLAWAVFVTFSEEGLISILTNFVCEYLKYRNFQDWLKGVWRICLEPIDGIIDIR